MRCPQYFRDRGLVTSASGTLGKKDDIKRRLDEAAKYAPAIRVWQIPALRARAPARPLRPG